MPARRPGGAAAQRPLPLLGWPALAAVLLAFCALAVGYARAVPPGEAPDEPSHVQYVMFLRERGRLPVIPTGGRPDMPQAKHPPLYYLFGAALAAGAPLEQVGFVDNPHFSFRIPADDALPAFVHPRDGVTSAEGRAALLRLRLASLLAGLITVAATWGIARTAWPNAPEMALASAAVAAFTPGFLLASATFNNDALAIAWAATSLFLAARIAAVPEAARGRREPVALGAALGLGLTTKLTALTVAPAVALALAIAGRRDRGSAARATVLVAAAGAVVGGWWPLRNALLYGIGDPLGLRRWTSSIPHLARRTSLWAEIDTYAKVQFTTYWGRFGWANVPMPTATYTILAALCATAVVGLVVLGLRRRTTPPPTRLVLVLSALAAVVAYAAVLRLGLRLNLVAAQGRYLYVVHPALAVLLAAGLLGWLPSRIRPTAAVAAALACAGLALTALVTVLQPAYRPPQPTDLFAAVERGAGTADVELGGQLRLVGHALAGDAIDTGGATEANGWVSADGPTQVRLRPGSELTVTLYAQAARPLWLERDPALAPRNVPPGFSFFAHFVDSTGEVVGRRDAPAYGGRFPAASWSTGETHPVQLRLRVDPDARQGGAALLMGAYPLDRPTERLVATAPDGRPLGDALRLEGLAIGAPPGPPPASELARRAESGRPAAVFELPADVDVTRRGDVSERALLLEAFETAIVGGQLEVQLVWRATAQPRRPYQVMLHLLDEAGALVAAADGPPVDGVWPTELWRPGELVLDVHRATVPDAPGRLWLAVGLYDLESGTRLAAHASGSPERVPDDAVVLTELIAGQ